jgi:hypothetical protein
MGYRINPDSQSDELISYRASEINPNNNNIHSYQTVNNSYLYYLPNIKDIKWEVVNSPPV